MSARVQPGPRCLLPKHAARRTQLKPVCRQWRRGVVSINASSTAPMRSVAWPSEGRVMVGTGSRSRRAWWCWGDEERMKRCDGGLRGFANQWDGLLGPDARGWRNGFRQTAVTKVCRRGQRGAERLGVALLGCRRRRTNPDRRRYIFVFLRPEGRLPGATGGSGTQGGDLIGAQRHVGLGCRQPKHDVIRCVLGWARCGSWARRACAVRCLGGSLKMG